MRKYSEKFLNDTEFLKFARIGFEFEFYMKDLSFYKTLELLNQYLSPVKVWGFRKYHSDMTPDSKNFKIEPDLSGGANMVELVTGPLDYFEAKFHLNKLLKFIQTYGYTNDKCSIHFNVSFNQESDKNLNDLNVLKLILTMDEDEIYYVYPMRKNNVYAKSVKNIIPYKDYDFNNVPIEIIKNNLMLPDDKYYGINFLHVNNPRETQRLEFRYIGGKDYEKNIGDISYFLDLFIKNVYNSIDAGFNTEDIEKIETYLEDNITNFKNFSKYDNFLIEFPTITLQVDQTYDYNTINAYYDRMYTKLFEIVHCIDSLGDCIINFVTETQRFELIDAQFKAIKNIKGIDFINCTTTEAIFQECGIINSNLTNCQAIKSSIWGSELTSSKVLNSSVESSELHNCYFMGGYMNGDMIGGVLRSGKLGPYANVSSETKIISETDNFFDTSFDEDRPSGGKKMLDLKSFKK
jgi:hypothetical protein